MEKHPPHCQCLVCKPLDPRKRRRVVTGGPDDSAAPDCPPELRGFARALAGPKVVPADEGTRFLEALGDLAVPPGAASLVVDQPPPVRSDREPVWEMVIRDMRERDLLGRERYGTPLQAFNGRDPMIDLYQELLDAAVYARQVIAERPTHHVDGLTGTASARLAWADALQSYPPRNVVHEAGRMLLEAIDRVPQGSVEARALDDCLNRLVQLDGGA